MATKQVTITLDDDGTLHYQHSVMTPFELIGLLEMTKLDVYQDLVKAQETVDRARPN